MKQLFNTLKIYSFNNELIETSVKNLTDRCVETILNDLKNNTPFIRIDYRNGNIVILNSKDIKQVMLISNN